MQPELIQVPDYDEDLEEAFNGPVFNEFYDDEYEEESQALIEATMEDTEPTPSQLIGQYDVGVYTQRQHDSAGKPPG